MWHPSGYREVRAARRGEATNRDRLLQPQEGLRAGRDFGRHAHRAGYQDRGEDLCLHTYGFYVNRMMGRPLKAGSRTFGHENLATLI